MQYLVGSASGSHKMLGVGQKLASLAGIVVCLGIFSSLQAHKARLIFLPDGVHFVDADCYSRMTRARIISEQPGTLITRHAFENYPYGVRPHTTAPMDYLIVGFGRLLGPGVDLDIAGAWISPLLGALLIIMAGLWAAGEDHSLSMEHDGASLDFASDSSRLRGGQARPPVANLALSR